jgi:hypothetical protein
MVEWSLEEFFLPKAFQLFNDLGECGGWIHRFRLKSRVRERQAEIVDKHVIADEERRVCKVERSDDCRNVLVGAELFTGENVSSMY